MTSSAPAETGDEPTDECIDDHVADLQDGAGCTEIWEHLSEKRACSR